MEDLVIESIQITGINCFYVRKTFQSIDQILGEDNLMKFSDAYLLEFYLDSVEGYGGEGQLISKFGIEIKNRLDFSVSVKRFVEEVKLERPMEGDLIWFPFSQTFFEILFVEDNIPFYEVGKNYIFKIATQTWYYGQEKVDTTEARLNDFTESKKEKIPNLSDNDEFNDFANDRIIDNNIFGVNLTGRKT